MKHILSVILSCLFVPASLQGQTFPVQNRNVVWYESPAKVGEEALPLGNGKVCACVYGIPGTELVRLHSADGKYAGCLRITSLGLEMYSNYCHSLDLDSALDVVEYQVPSQPGVTGVQNYYLCRRETFAPLGKEVLVMRFTTDAPQGLSFVVQVAKAHDGGDEIVIRNEKQLQIVQRGGRQFSRDGGVYVSGAQEAVLYYALAGASDDLLAQAAAEGVGNLLTDHVRQYRSAVDQRTLWLGEDTNHRPYNVRLKMASEEDRALSALWYRYGRYMGISHINVGEANYSDWSDGLDKAMVSTETADLIDLLPALPQDCQKEGRYTATVGDLHLDLEWRDGQITRLAATSQTGGTYRLRSSSMLKGKGLTRIARPIASLENQDKATCLYCLKAKAGVTHVLIGKNR